MEFFSRDWCVAGDCGEQVEGSGRRFHGHRGVRDGWRAADSLHFALTRRETVGPGQMYSWHARRVQGRPWSLSRETDSRVMVLGPASGKSGGQTGEDPRRSKGRDAIRPAFPGRRTDRRLPRSFGCVAASPDGRAEAADGPRAASSRFGGMPQAEVADLMQALGQDVLEERRMNSCPGMRLVRHRLDFAMLVADG